MAFELSSYLASGRNAVSALAGFAAGVGVHSILGTPTNDIVTGFNHIFNGANEIAVGVGTLTPIVMAAWAGIKGTLRSKVADVKVADPVVLAEAVKVAAPAVLLDAAADVAGTKLIRTTPELAAATTNPKVIS